MMGFAPLPAQFWRIDRQICNRMPVPERGSRAFWHDSVDRLRCGAANNFCGNWAGSAMG
jgi:hypothetical protein